MRDMRDANDLVDVSLPSNANKSREIEGLGKNDQQAQHRAASILGYQLHGNKCQVCGHATDESTLCNIGRQLYAQMRQAGAVE